MTRPIVTFTTDFGTTDSYVAQMKAAVLTQCDDVQLVDVTHEVPPQDVVSGAFPLERAVATFRPGTIHLGVVDPGVGTDRRILVVEANQQTVICPDNGLITWTFRLHKCVTRELTWRPRTTSNTFHGRDIMAPVAGMLCAGVKLNDVATTESIRPILAPIDLAPTGGVGQIIAFDRYGNAITNLRHPHDAIADVIVRGHSLGPLRREFASVTEYQPLAYIGSADLLEIAIRNGSAREALKLNVGDEVVLQ